MSKELETIIIEIIKRKEQSKRDYKHYGNMEADEKDKKTKELFNKAQFAEFRIQQSLEDLISYIVNDLERDIKND